MDGGVAADFAVAQSIFSHCGLDLTHARADDGPAYLTILLVGLAVSRLGRKKCEV